MCFYLKLEIAFPDITDWKKANGALLCFHCFCSGVLVLGPWHAKHPSPPRSSQLSAPSASSAGSPARTGLGEGRGEGHKELFYFPATWSRHRQLCPIK